MKKILLLTFILLLGIFAGCDSNTTTDSDDVASQNQIDQPSEEIKDSTNPSKDQVQTEEHFSDLTEEERYMNFQAEYTCQLVTSGMENKEEIDPFEILQQVEIIAKKHGFTAMQIQELMEKYPTEDEESQMKVLDLMMDICPDTVEELMKQGLNENSIN